MSQKLPVNGFEWVKDTSQFNEAIMNKVMRDISLRLMFKLLKIYMNFTLIYHFYLKV